MSDKTWRKLRGAATAIALLTVGIMVVVFFEEPYKIKSSPLGLALSGTALICGVFGIFVNYREKTGGVTLKTFWYVISFLVAAYIMTIIVDRFF
ncbi:hypothetical protein SAMN04487944_11658 [Gracilibacillus ureilyticus]|uniref:Uncharacterized protein n=1 Tax=Gracilibacillus ureilyticus TaxID=531814 RepID=A0A1H9U7V5_9BACI|nr:hypothetical protein [Gracilibacillus ureilyticus]SES05183.1 hypothetical protein SAMN04487944_11658 [Gracilibacillus ureilyticus]